MRCGSLRKLTRTVVAIDPQATNSEESDESGIAVASVYGSGDERQYSLDADYSGKYSPNGWATKAIDAYVQHEADAIVIETNQGGDMAEDTLRNAGFTVAFSVCMPVKASMPEQSRYLLCTPRGV